MKIKEWLITIYTSLCLLLTRPTQDTPPPAAEYRFNIDVAESEKEFKRIVERNDE